MGGAAATLRTDRLSNDVYPKLPGLTPETARDILPPPVSIKTTPSRREFRARSSSTTLYAYSLKYEFLRSDPSYGELQTLVGFYAKHGGPFDTWLFDDEDDNSASGDSFAVGDGATPSFQLLRSQGEFIEPVFDINGVPIVQVNGRNANLVDNSYFSMQFPDGQPYGYAPYDNASISKQWRPDFAGLYSATCFALQANDRTTAAFGLVAESGYTGGNVVGGIRGGRGGSTGWQPNTTYTVSCYAKRVNGAGWASGGISPAWNSGPRNLITVSNPPLTSNWQRYVFTYEWGDAVEANGRLYLRTEIDDTVAGDVLLIDGLQVVYGYDVLPYSGGREAYTIDGSGLVTFPVAPDVGTLLTWYGKFYRRCRFSDQKLSVSKFMQRLFSAGSVKFQTVPNGS